MQKSTVKHNYKKLITVFLAAVLLALVSVALMFAFPAKDAHAEGNDAISPTGTPDVRLSIDVNGQDAYYAQTLRDTTGASVAANNALRLKRRMINRVAVVDSYNDVHEGTDINSSSYTFVPESIKNDSSAFSVAVDTSNGSVDIYVTALSVTPAGYFSIQLAQSGGSAPVTVYFEVTVTDTFVALQDANRGGWSNIQTSGDAKTVKVGGKLDENAHEIESSLDYIVTANNYSDFTIDLSQHLLGRALYCTGTDGKVNTTTIMLNGGDSDRFWGISSITNFRITNVELIAGAFSGMIFTDPEEHARISPTATMRLELSTNLISSYTERIYGSELSYAQRIEKFWNSTHELTVTVSEVSNSTAKYYVRIPTRFFPANPQMKNINSSKLSLNVTSKYSYDISEDKYYDENGTAVAEADRQADAGYGSIIIRPSDLIEYSYPSVTYGGEMAFDRNATTSSLENYYKIEMYNPEDIENDTFHPSAYKVTLLANGSYNITFVVEYYTLTSNFPSTVSVTISITGFGGYSVEFASLEGKHAVAYNVLTASQFASLMLDGYQMTGAESLNPDELTVVLENNTLTLTPNVARIAGQTRAQVRMRFTNNKSQTVTIDSNSFTIDVNAGSFFARFDDWQAWLIIAACILGGLILILLIVWIFIHSISKHKQDELATQAPVSSYIVKLNSTIAANQAQQRMAATQALSQASNQMLLGAGPTNTPAASPDTLQLASGIPSTPGSMPLDSTPRMSEPMYSTPKETGEDYNALIAKYISDEELLERIFTEKYEPKGMVRRTFFKSKDLQARELEKEKNRIVERYKSPMPMDEAIMSEAESAKRDRVSTPSEPNTQDDYAVDDYSLDFDPDSPLFSPDQSNDAFSEEKIDIDLAPEESHLRDVERQNDILEKEIAELKARLAKVQAELDVYNGGLDELRAKIAQAEEDDVKYTKDIEDLEFKLASAKQKEKERITRDINIKEEQRARNKTELENLRRKLDGFDRNSVALTEILERLNAMQAQKDAEKQDIIAELERARADFDAYQQRLALVKARQELDAKLESLTPMLIAVNNSDYELRRLQNETAAYEKEREDLKSDVAAAKTQIMGTTDFEAIGNLNMRISDANARLSEIERDITKATKRKSELNIEFNAQRRKANDFVEKSQIPLEEVISAEDLVIGNIELADLKAIRERDVEEAEKVVAAAQAVYDDLATSAGDVTMIAMEIASNIKDIEDELAATQAELDAVNAQMEVAGDDEKLMLMVDQGDKADKVEELKERLKQANVDGTKRKMEAQSEYDSKIEGARQELDAANEELRSACAKHDDLVNNVNPLDLITSGSGVISQDQKKIEAENLKKQLEKSKNEIEQARLAAQMAQMEAEQAREDAARASDEAKAEAERKAQEAIEAAEQARLEAEQKARSEVEAAEQARLEAEAAAERAKREAEEALIAEAEAAKRKAEEEAEEAKRKAQEEIEEMRRKSEEEAEAKRLEEENKRKEEEERQKADNERKELIAKKVAIRKDQIIAIRENMKDIKGEEDAKKLREQLYTSQLSYDEDERGSSELMDFYNKTMDDIQHAGEIAVLKAENAKKPQRVVRKVTERVNRIAKRKPGSARPGARSGARSAARPGARPGARPAARPGARPSGAKRPTPKK